MRASLEVADVFRRHGAAYRQAHVGHLKAIAQQSSVGRVEHRVMGAIEACRTAALGGWDSRTHSFQAFWLGRLPDTRTRCPFRPPNLECDAGG
jgi:hypothetical protein